MAFFRRAAPVEAESDEPLEEHPAAPDPPASPPSRLQGTEALYGYVVGLELVVVAILNLTIRGGRGAPAHPQTVLQIVGLAVAVAFFGVLQTRNRTIAGIGAIVAAILVTTPKVPNSLGMAHIFGLVIPFVYGLIITQRQRKAMLASGRAGRNRRGGAAGGAAGADRAGARRAGRRDAKTSAPAAGGPRPSARYTPPKAKRVSGRGRVSGR